MRLKPDMVWLRCDAGEWRKVVVDVKITSTDQLNKAFNEKDEKNSVSGRQMKPERRKFQRW